MWFIIMLCGVRIFDKYLSYRFVLFVSEIVQGLSPLQKGDKVGLEFKNFSKLSKESSFAMLSFRCIGDGSKSCTGDVIYLICF